MSAVTPVISDFSRRKRGLPLLEFIFIFVACLFYSNYVVQAMYAFQMTIALPGYVVYFAFKEREYRNQALIFLLMLVLFSVLYLLLTDTLTISEYASNRNLKRFFSKYSQFMLLFAPVFMFYRAAKVATRWQVYLFGTVILFNLFSLARTAITAAEMNAEILHTFNAESVEETGLSKAAFYFVYAYTFLFLTCWLCYKYVKKPIVRYTALIIALFSFYFLFVAQFALSIVTSFLSLLYLYVITTRNSGKKTINVIFVLAILLMSPLLIKGIIMISPSRILNDRLAEVYDMLTGDDMSSGTDGKGRMELYWMCIKAFFSSPIIGNRILPLDGHATFLTVPADIGIYGIIFLYTTFKNAYKMVADAMKSKILYFKPLMLQIILMGFTNPIHSSPTIYILLFFLCPLAILLFIPSGSD